MEDYVVGRLDNEITIARSKLLRVSRWYSKIEGLKLNLNNEETSDVWKNLYISHSEV